MKADEPGLLELAGRFVGADGVEGSQCSVFVGGTLTVGAAEEDMPLGVEAEPGEGETPFDLAGVEAPGVGTSIGTLAEERIPPESLTDDGTPIPGEANGVTYVEAPDDALEEALDVEGVNESWDSVRVVEGGCKDAGRDGDFKSGD